MKQGCLNGAVHCLCNYYLEVLCWLVEIDNLSLTRNESSISSSSFIQYMKYDLKIPINVCTNNIVSHSVKYDILFLFFTYHCKWNWSFLWKSIIRWFAMRFYFKRSLFCLYCIKINSSTIIHIMLLTNSLKPKWDFLSHEIHNLERGILHLSLLCT